MIRSFFLIHQTRVDCERTVRYGQVDSQFGPVLAAYLDENLCEWWFCEKTSVAIEALKQRWSPARCLEDDVWVCHRAKRLLDEQSSTQLSVVLLGTNFQFQVWQALLAVPCGETWSYRQVAEHLGKPQAVRAVAHAIACNPVSWFLPCHRVVYADGRIGRYRWGEHIKKQLLMSENNAGACHNK